MPTKTSVAKKKAAPVKKTAPTKKPTVAPFTGGKPTVPIVKS